MRRSLLLAGLVYGVLYVTVSFGLDGGMADDAVEVHPLSALGNSDTVGGAARACTGCHVLNQMENGVGPHLVGVVDRPAGAVSGFAYSDAMRKVDIRWTREHLREFLLNPQAVVPGTAMVATQVDESTAEAIVNYLSRQH
jgi:cytochrome c2